MGNKLGPDGDAAVADVRPLPPFSKPPETKSVEQWASDKSTGDLWFNAAKTLRGWAVGQQLTESDFDGAVLAAQNVEARLWLFYPMSQLLFRTAP